MKPPFNTSVMYVANSSEMLYPKRSCHLQYNIKLERQQQQDYNNDNNFELTSEFGLVKELCVTDSDVRVSHVGGRLPCDSVADGVVPVEQHRLLEHNKWHNH